MTHKSEKIHDIMSDGTSQLGKLIAKAREIKQLNLSFSDLVGHELAAHCSVAHFQEGILEIIVSNAAMATKLRFMELHLLQSLRKHAAWMGLRSIKIKTHPG